MKIAPTLLLVSTPIGLVAGLYEAWRLIGPLTFVLVVMLGLLSAAIGSVVMTIRREQRANGERS